MEMNDAMSFLLYIIIILIFAGKYMPKIIKENRNELVIFLSGIFFYPILDKILSHIDTSQE